MFSTRNQKIINNFNTNYLTIKNIILTFVSYKNRKTHNLKFFY